MVNMKPSLDTKQFALKLDGVEAHCYLLNLKNSLFLWVGDESKKFDSLSLAQFVTLVSSGDSKVYSANIMGNILDPFHQSLCRKISSKLKMPVFLSLNIHVPQENSAVFEKQLIKDVITCFNWWMRERERERINVLYRLRVQFAIISYSSYSSFLCSHKIDDNSDLDVKFAFQQQTEGVINQMYTRKGRMW